MRPSVLVLFLMFVLLCITVSWIIQGYIPSSDHSKRVLVCSHYRMIESDLKTAFKETNGSLENAWTLVLTRYTDEQPPYFIDPFTNFRFPFGHTFKGKDLIIFSNEDPTIRIESQTDLEKRGDGIPILVSNVENSEIKFKYLGCTESK